MKVFTNIFTLVRFLCSLKVAEKKNKKQVSCSIIYVCIHIYTSFLQNSLKKKKSQFVVKETPNIKQTDVKYTEDLEGLGQMVGQREIKRREKH